MKYCSIIAACLAASLFLIVSAAPSAETNKTKGAKFGNCSILVKDSFENTLYSKNETTQMVPASTLKLLTALIAYHYLGNDFRFKTEFYLDHQNNLTIKGYGDPLLVSEVVSDLSENLSNVISKRTKVINNIVLDTSFFSEVSIPGITSDSSEPYDAPSGALCVNFNTVNFKKDANGSYISAEEQTPLLPFTINRIKSSGLANGRIILTQKESGLYPGHLFQYFLNNNGIKTRGKINTGNRDNVRGDLIYTHVSPHSLDDLVSKLLEFSNNFIANQLLITAGATAYGTPGTLEKGKKAAMQYASSILKLKHLVVNEGSGLSRQNKINAIELDAVLKEFEPRKQLMRRRGNEFFKTGTLSGVSTRAGYYTCNKGRSYRFVIMCNETGVSSESVINTLIEYLEAR